MTEPDRSWRRVLIEPDVCISSGECVRIAPETFEQQRSDGSVMLRDHALDSAGEQRIRHAVTACPSRALVFVEERLAQPGEHPRKP